MNTLFHRGRLSLVCLSAFPFVRLSFLLLLACLIFRLVFVFLPFCLTRLFHTLSESCLKFYLNLNVSIFFRYPSVNLDLPISLLFFFLYYFITQSLICLPSPFFSTLLPSPSIRPFTNSHLPSLILTSLHSYSPPFTNTHFPSLILTSIH